MKMVNVIGLKTYCGVMKLDFRCTKCGSSDYYVKTAIFPEKDSKLKVEFGTYYLKICSDCGYTEIYSAKVVDKELKKVKNVPEPKPAP